MPDVRSRPTAEVDQVKLDAPTQPLNESRKGRSCFRPEGRSRKLLYELPLWPLVIDQMLLTRGIGFWACFLAQWDELPALMFLGSVSARPRAAWAGAGPPPDREADSTAGNPRDS